MSAINISDETMELIFSGRTVHPQLRIIGTYLEVSGVCEQYCREKSWIKDQRGDVKGEVGESVIRQGNGDSTLYTKSANEFLNQIRSISFGEAKRLMREGYTRVRAERLEAAA